MKLLKTKILSPLNLVIVLSIMTVFILSSCAEVTDISSCTTDYPAGFWKGLLHGFIAPFTFIISLFNDHVALYEINNNGNWYNFGFVLGAGILFGGGGRAKKRRC